jgi:hypothetical protein
MRAVADGSSRNARTTPGVTLLTMRPIESGGWVRNWDRTSRTVSRSPPRTLRIQRDNEEQFECAAASKCDRNRFRSSLSLRNVGQSGRVAIRDAPAHHTAQLGCQVGANRCARLEFNALQQTIQKRTLRAVTGSRLTKRAPLQYTILAHTRITHENHRVVHVCCRIGHRCRAVKLIVNVFDDWCIGWCASRNTPKVT